MFFELWDYDYNAKENEYYLINLDEVIQINKGAKVYKIRDDSTGRVNDYYTITVYYTGKGNSWSFYYTCERDRNKVYNDLKRALKLYVEDTQTKEIEDIINTIEKDFHPLEDVLRGPVLEEVPEVKY